MGTNTFQPRRATLDQLTGLIREVEERGRRSSESRDAPAPALSTGWPSVDATLGGGVSAAAGLALGAIHEWIADWFGVLPDEFSDETDTRKSSGRFRSRERRWFPPLAILTHFAWRLLEPGAIRAGESIENDMDATDGWIVWIGARVRPSVWPLARTRDEASPVSPESELLRRSIFLEPPDEASRVWAIDLALRCPAVRGVIADGSGLDAAATRRLQLAAEAGRSLGLLARPPTESREISTATTRWVVRPASPADWSSASIEAPRAPGWTVELRRSRGIPLSTGAPRRWIVQGAPHGERHGVSTTNLVAVPAHLVDRSRAATPEANARRRFA
ncbi:MAG: ImuA family protein [Phycisphaerales bacterium]